MARSFTMPLDFTLTLNLRGIGEITATGETFMNLTYPLVEAARSYAQRPDIITQEIVQMTEDAVTDIMHALHDPKAYGAKYHD